MSGPTALRAHRAKLRTNLDSPFRWRMESMTRAASLS